jgi:hypothetical protein
MDPQVAWEQMVRAYAEKDWSAVREHATALSTWLRRGGFPPTVIAEPPMGDDFNFVLAIVGCKYAHAKAKKEGGQ